jgi:hypothetical protein
MGPVTIERFVIMVGIFVALFIVIRSAISIAPFFDCKMIEILASLSVTLLILLTGIFDFLVSFYYDLLSIIFFLDKLGPFKIFVYIVVMYFFIVVVNKLSKVAEKNITLEGAEQTRENIELISKRGEVLGKK